jgi:predicted AAA+ superfamily ATPase
MLYIKRSLEKPLDDAVARGKSVLLLGPRQTGKTTLLERLKADASFSLNFPDTRIRYEKALGTFTREVEAISETKRGRPLVAIDEIQKVPPLMDAIQDLIDRRRASFIITGSSARKLRRGAHVNWLPGRVVPLRLDPYTLEEMPNRPLPQNFT